MTTNTDSLFLEHFQQIGAGINAIKETLTELNQRLAMVERCVVNIHGNTSTAQTTSRAVWTEDERTAFCGWLAENLASAETIPLAAFENNSKSD